MSENYKDLDEIRKMISAGNSFNPIIRKTNDKEYSIFFQIWNSDKGYELITQRRSDRPLIVRHFSTSDAALALVQNLGFKMAVIRFFDVELN
jgi:hypothetical protein